VTKLQKLETEEKRRVRGATPEEELKAKQLSETAHVDATLQGNYKFATTNFTTKTQRTRRQRILIGGIKANRGRDLR
jgi:hypothetical protein